MIDSDCGTGTDEVIDLGFLEKTESWKLESRFFPSKVGGRPAWLDLSSNIPNFADIKCSNCEQALIFMCQVYAPIDAKTDCFHRTIYIFICRNEKCCVSNSALNMKIFRSQLSRNNNYYPYEPPIEDESGRGDLTSKSFNVRLCEICGISSNSHCAKCKLVYYCCKQHQLIDWKNGHKVRCSATESSKEFKVKTRFPMLFPENELITETEDLTTDTDLTIDNEHTEMQKYSKLVEEGKAGTLQDVPLVEDELSKFAFKDEDEAFTKFKERTKHFPDQVLRYGRGGKPLWISDSHQATEKDIPACQYCNGKRIFEFQILPQMLNHLDLDTTESSIDWGVLAVYTCENSCNTGPAYKQEFIWKQDISTS